MNTTNMASKFEKFVPSMRVTLLFPPVLTIVLGGLGMLVGNTNGIKFLGAGAVTLVLVGLGMVLVPVVNKAYFTMIVRSTPSSDSKYTTFSMPDGRKTFDQVFRPFQKQ